MVVSCRNAHPKLNFYRKKCNKKQVAEVYCYSIYTKQIFTRCENSMLYRFIVKMLHAWQNIVYNFYQIIASHKVSTWNLIVNVRSCCWVIKKALGSFQTPNRIWWLDQQRLCRLRSLVTAGKLVENRNCERNSAFLFLLFEKTLFKDWAIREASKSAFQSLYASTCIV